MAPASNSTSKQNKDVVTHYGGCHCGKVQWKVLAPSNITVWDCNCSICTIKSNVHFIVPRSRFTLLSGEDNLTTYTYNTHRAKHKFCRTCGVQSFYHPRSNPDGIGLLYYAVKPGTIKHVEWKTFDGQNWEKYYQRIKPTISQHSKL